MRLAIVALFVNLVVILTTTAIGIGFVVDGPLDTSKFFSDEVRGEFTDWSRSLAKHGDGIYADKESCPVAFSKFMEKFGVLSVGVSSGGEVVDWLLDGRGRVRVHYVCSGCKTDKEGEDEGCLWTFHVDGEHVSAKELLDVLVARRNRCKTWIVRLCSLLFASLILACIPFNGSRRRMPDLMRMLFMCILWALNVLLFGIVVMSLLITIREYRRVGSHETWSFSTEEDGSRREQKQSDRISAVGEALTKPQQKPKHVARTGGGKPIGMKTPVNEVVSAVSKSAMDSFVVHRHVPPAEDAAQYASDLNDEMDEMLNRSDIPADYAEAMVAIFRDKSHGDVVRDFAVQHIGLYAETLNMRGKYDADATESTTLRDALWDAAEETRTIVAAAAFRALADMAAFDQHVDAKRLDSRLATCIADSSASPAARVMAAQLCGERRVVAAKPTLARIAADRSHPEPLRLAAANAAKSLAE